MFEDYIKSLPKEQREVKSTCYRNERRLIKANKFQRHSPGTKWTREQCYATAKRYTSFMKFHDNEPGAYSAAWKNGWLKDYTWLNRRSKKYPYDKMVIRNTRDRLIAMFGYSQFYIFANLFGEDEMIRMADRDEKFGIEDFEEDIDYIAA